MNLKSLHDRPYELLLEMEERARGAATRREGKTAQSGGEWVVVDLKAFLGGGISMIDRRSRVLVLSSRDVPTGLLVDEVLGFRHFNASDYRRESLAPAIRCDAYLEGSYRRGAEAWPCFRLSKLLGDEHFLNAAEHREAVAV